MTRKKEYDKPQLTTHETLAQATAGRDGSQLPD